MMHTFLANNRDELIARCKAKVALRPKRAATVDQLSNGVPIFLAQLQRTLEAEEVRADDTLSLKISGAAGGDALTTSEMGISATAHGRDLLKLGFSVDQVVHDYGDLCQSITDLACERDAPFSVDEFRTLNRCLDNAIASAVTGFSVQRDAGMTLQKEALAHERLGMLAHELRNSLATASYAVHALEQGNLPVSGATGSVLKRSLATLKTLVSRSLAEARATTDVPTDRETFSLAALIADAREGAKLYSSVSGCTFTVAHVDPLLKLSGDRERLLAALENILQNAFKFTREHTEVTLAAYAADDEILIDVGDECGGWPQGQAAKLFSPLMRRRDDRSGLGLGLTLARHNVESDGGVLSVRDNPGIGCIFTICLPNATAAGPR